VAEEMDEVLYAFLKQSFAPGAHEYRLSKGKPEIILVISRYFSDNGR
jgi:hypothetical protein